WSRILSALEILLQQAGACWCGQMCSSSHSSQKAATKRICSIISCATCQHDPTTRRGRMNSQTPYGNRYARCHACNQRDPDGRLREEALGQAIEAVEAGEIVTLDGVRSPLSKKIAEHHGLDQFEI